MTVHERINWTTGKLALLAELVRQGLSPKEIIEVPEFAAHTRNSIIGMCYREGYKIAKKPHPKKKDLLVKELLREKPIMFPISKPKPLIEALRVSLLTAANGQCRYIIGGEAEDGTPYVCGMPIVTGFSLCLNHKVICYNRHEKTKEV